MFYSNVEDAQQVNHFCFLTGCRDEIYPVANLKSSAYHQAPLVAVIDFPAILGLFSMFVGLRAYLDDKSSC